MKNFLFLLSIILISSSLFLGQAKSQSNLDYPELMVTPLSSKRIQMEMMHEEGRDFSRRMPMQISAMTTFLAGFVQMSNVDKTKDVNSRSPYAGIVVGGAWLAANYMLANSYRPYTNANNEIGKMPIQTKRQQLEKERMAEEAINAAGSLDQKLAWLSFLTNAGAAGYMASNAKEETSSTVLNIVAVAASLTPLIFSSRWEQVKKEQKKYKKKIFGPVAQATMLMDPTSKMATPGFLLSLSF